MSMRAEHSGNPAIKIPAECHFLGGRLGMDVYKDHFRADAGQQPVRGAEGILVGLHEDPSLKIEDGIGDARGERAFINTEAGGACGVISGPHNAAWPIVAFRGDGGEIVDDLAFVPYMIAGGKDVGAEVEEVFGKGWRQ